MNLSIKSKIKNYNVFFNDSFEFIDDLLTKHNPIFIIDKNVYDLYKKYLIKIPYKNVFLLKAIEANKTFEYTNSVYDFLLKNSIKRNSTIISIGGGITQDITGFVASTLYRGVNWIFVPTTFLAMTDSCIGSKTSINYKTYKNLMGTFYPPSEIYINKDFLLTLSKLDFYSGVGEAIKLQLMNEDSLKSFNKILEKIQDLIVNKDSRSKYIYENLLIKKSYIDEDEFDLGRRNLLNYGHCFGHALETSSNYYIPHGIAVIIGMIFANFISVGRNLGKKEDILFINNMILIPCIPLKLRMTDFNSELLLRALKSDKKRVGKYLSIIMPDDRFFMTKVDDVSDNEFLLSLEKLQRLLFP